MTPTTTGTSDATKTLVLASRDLSMLATAGSYDVNDKVDRTRSALDLSRLFFKIAAALEPDLFIEAGAKDAASSRRARRVLDPARIVAFEANPFTHEAFGALHDNAGAGVEYRHLALSSEVGEVTFNVLRSEDGEPRVDGQGSLLVHEDNPAGSIEVTVPATTLDSFFADHAYERSAVWVDVEGAMEQVLGGARETFDRAAVVITEVEDRAYWDGQWMRGDVVSWFYDRGLLPVARDYQSRYQYNIVFVRADLLDHDRVRWLLTAHHSTAAAGRRAARRPQPDPARKRARRLEQELTQLQNSARLQVGTQLTRAAKDPRHNGPKAARALYSLWRERRAAP